MKMKNIFLLLVMMCLVRMGISQNLVGMSVDDIKSYLNEKKGVSPDSIFLNKNSDGTSYLSFSSAGKKIVYFLDSDNKCSTYRVIYPYSQLNAVLKNLDGKFTAEGRFKWTVPGRQTFVITLEPNDDFFVTDMFLQ
jgi:hypothetical protein